MTREFVDQFSDSSFKVLYAAFSEHPETEPLIKSASIDASENDSRENSAFAWPEMRLFPIDSPDQAVLSKLYMSKQAGIPAEVAKRCDDALAIYEIDLPLQEKVASDEHLNDKYLLPDQKKFLVNSPTAVKMAEEMMSRQRRNLDTSTQVSMAVTLVKQAADMGVRPNANTLSHAGLTMSDTGVLRDWIEARAVATDNAICKDAYTKMAELIGQRTGLESNREELTKVASALHELDEMAGLSKHYGRKLPDPMTTVFNTDKLADEMLTLAGYPVSLETLLSVDPAVYADVFGDDVASEFVNGQDIDPEQLKVILPTVPLDLQKVLAQQLGLR